MSNFKQKLNGLNGWQRIWVSITVTYVALIFGGISLTYKSGIKHYKLIHNEEVKLFVTELEDPNNLVDFFDNKQVMQMIYEKEDVRFPARYTDGYKYLDVGDSNKYLQHSNANFINTLRSIHRKPNGKLYLSDPSLGNTVVNIRSFLKDLQIYYAGDFQKNYKESRNKFIVFSLLFIFVPPIFIYLIGLGVAWIISGFKK